MTNKRHNATVGGEKLLVESQLSRIRNLAKKTWEQLPYSSNMLLGVSASCFAREVLNPNN